MQDRTGKSVEGILWGEGAVCNVKWAGVRLRDLVLCAGLSDDIPSDAAVQQLHLCFASHVTTCQEDGWFGASIPLEKALDECGDAILAYEVCTHSPVFLELMSTVARVIR